MTQQEFADGIGIARGNISAYEVGKNAPSDAVISLICTKYNVNEKWLRTGEGEMFIELSRSDEIAQFVGQLMTEEDDSFKKRLVSGLAALDDNGWKVLESFLDSIQIKRTDYLSPMIPRMKNIHFLIVCRPIRQAFLL